jgi:GAF domain-containing protein/DNA-binding CsgD family transcriptional regulator
VSLPAAQVAAELTDELAVIRLDLKEMLTTAVTTLSRVRPGTWTALVTNNDPSTSCVVVADESNPKIARYVDQYMSSLLGQGTVPTTGMSRTVIETGEPVLVAEVPLQEMFRHTTPAAREWYDRHPLPMDVRTMASALVPMRARGQVVGTLQLVEWNPDQPMTEADVGWLQVIGDRLGWMVEHAQCHGASIARLERLAAIRNVGLAVASSQDLRLTLQVILEQVTGRLGVDAADVLVLDDTGTELHPAAAVGFRTTPMAEMHLPLPPEVAEGWGLVRSFDGRSDPGWTGQFRRRSLFTREGFQSYRSVALRARGSLLGMLEVFHRSSLDLDQEWLGFLDSMAINAAIAIQNSALRDQVERRGAGHRPAVPKPDLSSLEWRVLGMVVEGSTNREIAAAVHLSENTIKFHIRRLLDRVGAVNRTDLARKATQNSWL